MLSEPIANSSAPVRRRSTCVRAETRLREGQKQGLRPASSRARRYHALADDGRRRTEDGGRINHRLLIVRRLSSVLRLRTRGEAQVEVARFERVLVLAQ